MGLFLRLFAPAAETRKNRNAGFPSVRNRGDGAASSALFDHPGTVPTYESCSSSGNSRAGYRLPPPSFGIRTCLKRVKQQRQMFGEFIGAVEEEEEEEERSRSLAFFFPTSAQKQSKKS